MLKGLFTLCILQNLNQIFEGFSKRLTIVIGSMQKIYTKKNAFKFVILHALQKFLKKRLKSQRKFSHFLDFFLWQNLFTSFIK